MISLYANKWQVRVFKVMSIPTIPLDVKLVISVLYVREAVFEKVIKDLLSHFSSIDYVSEKILFKETSYYNDELGDEIFRKFISFTGLFNRSRLSDVKLITNKIEGKFLDKSGKREINLDPGFLSLENFILATGKNYSHRIYLSDGIYGDLTLIFKNRFFETLPWTYPDYASKKVQDILLSIRKIYKFQLTGKLML